MALTKSDDITPSGDNQIVNPTPVDADSITTQIPSGARVEDEDNNCVRACSTYVLPSTCKKPTT